MGARGSEWLRWACAVSALALATAWAAADDVSAPAGAQSSGTAAGAAQDAGRPGPAAQPAPDEKAQPPDTDAAPHGKTEKTAEADESDKPKEDESDKTRKPAERKHLRIIPEDVLGPAAEDHQWVTAGPLMTSVWGNAAQFRRYLFIDPSRPMVIYDMRLLGTDSHRQYMYNIYARTPFLNSSAAGIMVRDFDGATTVRSDWQQNGFYRNFGPDSTPSSRSDAESLVRWRMGHKGWLDVTHQRRALASPATSTRPISFLSDEVAFNASWRFSGTLVGVYGAFTRYTDRTAALSVSGLPVSANRTATEVGVRAGSLSHAEAQWRIGMGYKDVQYPGVAAGRYSTLSAGGGITFHAGGDLDLSSGFGHVTTYRTLTRNVYNPRTTTIRFSGTYKGFEGLRTSFGYERRMGYRLSLQPDPVAPQAFLESQALDRFWLRSSYRAKSKLDLELVLRRRTLSGSVTNYLGINPAVLPVMLYPVHTTADFTAGYPTGGGVVKAGFTYGLHSNNARATQVQSLGVTGFWSRSWDDHWTTLAQLDNATYWSNSVAPANTQLRSAIGVATYGFGRGSASASYGIYNSVGSYSARYQQIGLSFTYRPDRDTSLTLGYDRLRQTGTGILDFRSDIARLTWSRSM